MAIEKFYSAKDIQDLLSIGQTKAYSVIARCDHVKIGGTGRVPESALERFLKEHIRHGINFELLATSRSA